MKSIFFALVMYSFFCVSAFAAPASWYQWKSKLNNEQYCAQTSPGFGWEQNSGPYKDAHCEIRVIDRNKVLLPNPTVSRILHHDILQQ